MWNMLKRKTPKYFLVTWIGFFFALLITAISISFILYKNFERITLNIISSNNHELLVQAENIANHMQEVIKNSGMQTFYNPSVTKLRTSSSLTNFQMINGIRALDSFAGYSPYIHSVYVYNSKTDYIYTSSNVTSDTKKRFYDQEAIHLLKSSNPSDRLKPVVRRINNPFSNSFKDIYTFFMYELASEQDKFENAMLINVDSDWMNQMLNKMNNNDEENVFIVDKEGKIIGKSYKNVYYNRNFIQKMITSDSSCNYFIDKKGSQKTIYMYVKFKENDWYFVREIPYSYIMKDINLMKTNTFYIILGIFIICSIASIIMIMRFYLPFNKMVDSISKVKEDSSKDIHSILNNLDFIVEDSIKTEKIKESYLSLLKEDFFKQLLKYRNINPVNLIQSFRDYDINLSIEQPLVIIMIKGTRLDDYMSAVQSVAKDSLVEGIMINTHSILFVQNTSKYMIKNICHKIHYIDHSVVAYSNSLSFSDNISRAYSRVWETMAYHIFYPNQWIFSESMLEGKLKENMYPIKIESAMIQALKEGDFELAKKQYQCMLETMLGYRFNTIKFTFKRLHLSMTTLYKDIESAENTDSQYTSFETIEEKFNAGVSFYEISTIFYDLFNNIIIEYKKYKQNKKATLIEHIKSKIETEYKNQDLSLQVIADDLGMSSTYMGKIFKSSENISISKYINKVRLEKAKILIQNSNLFVKDIAKEVGFTNSQYFYTLFKKHTQKTPKEFRLEVRQKA